MAPICRSPGGLAGGTQNSMRLHKPDDVVAEWRFPAEARHDGQNDSGVSDTWMGDGLGEDATELFAVISTLPSE
jgi:hypothetical protein